MTTHNSGKQIGRPPVRADGQSGRTNYSESRAGDQPGGDRKISRSPESPLEAAWAAHEAGISPFPVKRDKRPDTEGKSWEPHEPTLRSQVEAMFGNGKVTGLAVKCGPVSSSVSGHSLECLDVEGKAVEEGIWAEFKKLAKSAGLYFVLKKIMKGYGERTPSGGHHLFAYVPEHLSKNAKLARRPATDKELVVNPADKIKTLMETKGKGGYAIVAPSLGESGSWELLSGGFDFIETVTEDEWAALTNLARSFDALPPSEHVRESNPFIDQGRPGDAFNREGSWDDVDLEGAGWVKVGKRSDGTEYWRRPGKDFGISATLNHGGHDMLHVFSSSTVFPESDQSYKKFSAFAHLHFDGDFAAAARKLAEMGYSGEDSEDALSTYGASPRRPTLAEGPWPKLDATALYGLAGEVVETLAPHTEADPAGVLTTFLTIFGALVGPGPHAEVEGVSHPARLFLAHTGETARSRKGTSYKVTKLVFRNNRLWGDNFEFVGLSTGEGLVKDVADTMPEPGEKVRRAGRPDKRRLIVETEFARVLSVASRDGNTLSPLLRQAWDGDTLAIKTKKEPLTARGASISMIGQITTEELTKKMPDTEAASGFANRYLFVRLARTQELPEGGSLPGNVWFELEEEVSFALDRARSLGNVVLKRTDEAKERWAEIYHEMANSPHRGLLGSVTARAEAQTLRLSVAYAVVDGSEHIELAHVEAAYAVWRYCEASAAHIFGGSTGNAYADRIWRALDSADGGLSRTDISKVFGRNLSADALAEAIGVLERLGLIRTWTEETAGRPREMVGKG